MSRDEMHELRRQVRRLRIFAAGSTVLLAALMIMGLRPPRQEVSKFEKIEAERIDIVDADGDRSLVLSNRERFPPPVIGGEEFERSIQPAGLVLYDGDGNEMGGMGTVDVEGRARRTLLVFDYRNSEAIGYSAGETDGGDAYSASLTIADRVPLEADIRDVGTTGTRRINLRNADGDASLVLNDADGNPRIRLYVDRDGESGIEMLSRDGEVVERLGPSEGR